MKFALRTWQCDGNKNHGVIEVSFEAQDIAEACRVADAKVRYINVHNPGGIRRSPAVIRNRIVAGKLADAAVGALLRHRIDKSGLAQTVSVAEYDQVRRDGFEFPDPYDLELHRLGQQAPETIEVRSSFCYRLAPPDKIVKKLSIYGWYTSANKPAEPPRDWYWQVIYYLRPRDIPQDDGPRVGIFEDALESGELRGYVVGGASRDLLIAKGTNRSDQDGAWYRAISPICSGMDCQGMLSTMQI